MQKGLKVDICLMKNTKYPTLVGSRNVSEVLEGSLSTGNYYIRASNNSSEMYLDIEVQVRLDKTTVAYDESLHIIGKE